MYGAEHPNTVQFLANLADIARKLDRLDEAHSLYTRTLKAYTKAYGEDHLEVAEILNSLVWERTSTRVLPVLTRSKGFAGEAEGQLCGGAGVVHAGVAHRPGQVRTSSP